MVEVAVAPSVRSPFFYLRVNLAAGDTSPGTAALRALLICPKAASGTITPDTQVAESVAGEAAVSTLLGAGTPGHLAAKAAFVEEGLMQLDVVAPTASAGVQATGTIPFAGGPPTATWVIDTVICGRPIQSQWLAGQTFGDAADAHAAAINQQTTDLPVTATALAGAVTITFKVPGAWGNDCLYKVTSTGGAGGTPPNVALTSMTGGTLEPTITTALASVARKEYDLIYLAVSNADAAAASTTSGPGRLKTHIAGLDSGRRAKLQQAIIATTGTLSAAKVGADQHNFAPFEYLHSEDGQSLPAEWGGAELGSRIREETVRPNTNRAEMPYRATLYGPANLTADALTDIEVESALQSGVTPVVYDSTDTPAPARPITTYYKDAAGAPDDRVLDVPVVSGVYAYAKHLRTALPRKYRGVSVVPNQPPGSEPLPDGVIEVGEIEAEVISLTLDYIALGVVDRTTWETKLANGQIVVRINPQDSTQVDVEVPTAIVPILAKLGVVVNQVGVVR